MREQVDSWATKLNVTVTYWQYRGGISDYSADFTATDSSGFSLNCPAMYGWLIEFDRNPASLYVRVASANEPIETREQTKAGAGSICIV